MKTLVIEGKIIQVGKYDALQHSAKVTVSIPSSDNPTDEGYEEEEHQLEMETDEDTAKYFASHMFDRVRVSITIIPEPQLIDGGKEEEDSPGQIRSPRKPHRIQDDNGAG